MLLVHCSSTDTNDAAGDGGTSGPDATASSDGSSAGTEAGASDGDAPATKANVVFILADDFSMNLLQYMPHVLAMQKAGVTFSHYFVTDSLCCPSRTSIFTGRYPHDSHVFTNSGDAGGYDTFMAWNNDQRTFGTTLKGAGYRTAMMGKYLNGYQPGTSEPKTQGVPMGWTTWSVAGNGYPEFNYALNETGNVVSYGNKPADYLTDVISKLGSKFVTDSGNTPFLLELATFAPHAPYTPAPRHASMFPGLKVPRNAAYAARPDASSPTWLKAIPALTQNEMDNLDASYRMRAQAVQAIDEMIASLEATLKASGHDKDTYIVFSGDNGYHMGEHSLRAGKQTAFDTDINVPLIVTGPGVPAGKVVDSIVQNIDLCPTFAELGVTPPPTTVNGRSIVPLLHGMTPSDWRNLALVEHHGQDLDPTDPDMPETNSGNPPTYEALRLPTAVYVEYTGGETEYYDIASDPFELKNLASTLPSNRAAALHSALDAVKNCHDAATCWSAQHYTGP